MLDIIVERTHDRGEAPGGVEDSPGEVEDAPGLAGGTSTEALQRPCVQIPD